MNRLLVAMLLLLAGCGPAAKKNDRPEAGTLEGDFKLPYQLTAPAETYTLPKELKEVSGLTYFKENQLLCVQDEEAVVYVYDTQKKKVTKDFGFGGYGDFEGIEYVNEEVYVLESNGNLFRFEPESTRIHRTKTDLPEKTEVEGLGYNPKTKRLLIAVKNGKGSSDKAVYSFDLLNRTVYKEMSLNDEQLKAAGIDPNTYKPSGIAVHPITGEWYILTSAGKRLLITSRQAKIIYSEPLDPGNFASPKAYASPLMATCLLPAKATARRGIS